MGKSRWWLFSGSDEYYVSDGVPHLEEQGDLKTSFGDFHGSPHTPEPMGEGVWEARKHDEG